VKNRGLAILLILLACVPVLLKHAKGDGLLTDSDTNFLIYKLNQHNDPMRWFTHDWPLENHFYRPISTLAFELDNRLHPGNGGAFGLTNAIICALCILATAWFVTEAKKSLAAGVVAAWLASTWTLGGWFFGDAWKVVAANLPWLILGLVVVRIIQDRKMNWQGVITALGSFFVFGMLIPKDPNLSIHTVYWLPGRTATVMTIFAMVALASYVRFERLGAPRAAELAPGATDEPATRTSTQQAEPRNRWGWFALSGLATALALGSYEQAVMIPFVVFCLGVWLRTDRVQTRFAFQLMFWGLLIGYVLVRLQYVPLGASGYQKQQFRSGPGLWIDVFNYLFPALLDLKSLLVGMSGGLLLIITETFWNPVLAIVSNVSAWVSMRKRLLPSITLIFMVTLAYLPMAFLKQFGHYHYWPAMMMTLFVIVFWESYWKLLVTAVSPQAFQAPQRPDRAPGSLPRL
jgi:uncharacterized membrane protein